MPGYMMHLVEGQMILNKFKKTNSSLRLSENDFLIGCLLPDAVSDKELTHFRPVSQKMQITKYPDMRYVLETYQDQPLSSCDLGILAHLHIDALYVSDFWPKHFTFLDVNEKYTNITSDIDHVLIYSSGERVPFDQFFSDTWFYGEYDRLNPYIISTINPPIPDISTMPDDIHIHECRHIDLSSVKTILSTLSQNISLEYNLTTYPDILPKIFPKEDILEFLEETADAFIEKYFSDKCK